MRNVEHLIETVFHSLRNKSRGSFRKNATLAILLELQIPTKSAAFDYLCTGIQLYCQDPTQEITTSLYPAITQKYSAHLTTMQIERSIRQAIQVAWEQGDPELWRTFFPNASVKKASRPTNMEFISRIARIIELCEAMHFPEDAND